MALRIRLLVTACAALVALAVPAAPSLAAPPKPAALSDQDRADVARIEGYLNQLRTATATFLPSSRSGSGSWIGESRRATKRAGVR